MSTSTTNANEATSKSTETFISALVLNAAIAGIEFGAFLLIRNGFPRIYQPRVDLPAEDKRAKPLPKNPFHLIPAILLADDEDIVRTNGLEAYLFVRFLKLMVWIFAPIALITWAILLPVYGTSTGTNQGLNQFTFGNVGTNQQSRLWATLVLSWGCTLYILFMIRREFDNFIVRRQQFLTSKQWSTRAQSRTVLLTGIPDDYCNMEHLEQLTSYLPGGVRKIWLARDIGKLEDVYERRQKAAKKLEGATNKVIKLADKLVRKNKVPAEGNDVVSGKGSNDAETGFGGALARYIPDKKRPTTRVGGKIPFITGKKVDTIEWSTDELATTNAELREMRMAMSDLKAKSAAFILFNDQIAAHMFAQCLAHELPLRMSHRYINVDPDDVIWSHTLNINPYSQKLRQLVSWSVTLAVCIFWSFPTAFVTSISNVSNLCSTVSWLSWLCTLPSPINGIIQGILPPVALMLLFALLPPFLRFLAVFEGTPLRSLVEHSLQKRYFIFLFIQGFIVATLSSGIMAGISQITDNPSSTVQLLANNLPKASIFFLTLIVTSGLSGAAGGILQIAKLAIYYIKVVLLGGSPRSLWKIRYTMPDVSWGTTYPAQLLLVVIAVAYSTIAPLVAGFAALTFALYYFMFKYCFIWIFDQPAASETGGLHFKTALNQIFAGIYIQLLSLIGLFFLARDTSTKVSAVPQAALTIVLLIFVILFQLVMHMGYSPLVDYLPLSMAQRMNANESKFARELHHEKQRKLADGRNAAGTDLRSDNKEYPSIVGQSASMLPRESNGTATSHDGSPSQHQNGLNTSGEFNTSGNTGPDALSRYDSQVTAGRKQDRPHTPQNHNESEEDLDELGELNENAFYHPALWKDQPMLWIPRDKLGLSRDAIARANAKGVDMTDTDASINDKGKIEVSCGSLPGVDFD